MTAKELESAFRLLLSTDQANSDLAVELLNSPIFSHKQVEAYAQENFGWAMQGKWYDGNHWKTFINWKQLASLQYLDLAGTKITSLPESIGQLVSLKDLNLSGTQLTSLPAIAPE